MDVVYAKALEFGAQVVDADEQDIWLLRSRRRMQEEKEDEVLHRVRLAELFWMIDDIEIGECHDAGVQHEKLIVQVVESILVFANDLGELLHAALPDR